MTTPTTLRDREPRTEAGRTFTEGSYQEMRRLMGDRPYSTLDVVLAIEEQAATEARRELLAKVDHALADVIHALSGGDLAGGLVAAHVARDLTEEQP